MSEVRPDYHKLTRTDVIAHLPGGGGLLLDVGGGVGATAVAAKQAGKARRVGVIDLVADAKHPEVDFSFAGDLENEQLLEAAAGQEGQFDVILCLDVLEHLRDPWSIVKRLHQIVKPGGIVVASIPNVRHYSVVVPLVFGGAWTLQDTGILDRTHLRFFVKDTAAELMTSSGMDLEAVIGLQPQRGKIKMLNTLTFGLLKNFTSLQYLVVVRRP